MIEQHAENIYSFRIVLPRNPLGWLNCYVIKGVNGGRDLLIDSGFNTPRCLADLKKGMAELDMHPENTDVFFTHAHFDHLGNASNLQAMGCRLLMGEREYAFYQEAPWVTQKERSRKDGIPDRLRGSLDVNKGCPAPGFTVETVEEGQTLCYGGYELECIQTPGHTPGHICLYDRQRKLMFTGDSVLFDITPNITYIEGYDTLTDYLRTLEKLERYEVELALPAHKTTGGKTFLDRVHELQRHHAARLDEAEQVVRALGEATGFDAASRMTWSIKADSWDAFPDNQQWFATAETLAHLVCLETRGRLKNRMDEKGMSLYSCI